MPCCLCRGGQTEDEARAWSDNSAFLAWAEGSGAIIIANELKVLQSRYQMFLRTDMIPESLSVRHWKRINMRGFLQVLRTRAASRAVASLTATAEGREGLLQGLGGVLKTDGALRAQLAALLSTQLGSRSNNGILIPEAARARRSVP